MKIIVPMAGRGSRLRPHTLTTPKPLVPVAGVPIVNRLVKDISRVLATKVDEIAYIIGDSAYFGDDVVDSLTKLSESIGAKTKIYRQLEPLGTGHAVMCAKSSLSGPAIVAYADTLIRANLKLNLDSDGVIWVKEVEDPSQFGVVKLNQNNHIIELIEKPKKIVSRLAAIGIYYFKEISELKDCLQVLQKKIISTGREFLINDGIEMMIKNNKIFTVGEVNEWMDCGNPKVTIETNQKMLDFLYNDQENLKGSFSSIESKIIEPCFIGNGVKIINSTIGPHVSINDGSIIDNCLIKNSIIQKNSQIKNANFSNSMIGNHVIYNGDFTQISIGDFSKLD